MANYSLGLDLGIASIGWAMVDIEKEKIMHVGVRCFDSAENSKTGESLNLPRRQARGMRRLIRRKKQRLGRIYDFLQEKNILSEETISFLKHQRTVKYDHREDNPWRLRSKALEEKLTEKELGIVLLHIAKHRGFRSMKKEGSVDKKSEDGKVLQAKKKLKAMLEKGEARTLGELYWKNPDSLKEEKKEENSSEAARAVPGDLSDDDLLNLQRRNKEGHYYHTAVRESLIDELKTIFDIQKQKGHSNCTPENGEDFVKKFNCHTPINKKQILSLVGNCTFEKEEKRAPLHSLTYEYFKWRQEIAHLSFRKNRKKYSITPEQQKKLRNFFQNNVKKKITYKELRKNLDLEQDEEFFYIKHSQKEDIEKNVFFTFKIISILRAGLKGLGLTKEKIETKCASLLADWRENLNSDHLAKIDLMVEAACYFPEEKNILEHFEKKAKEQELEIDDDDKQLCLYLDGKVAKPGRLSFKAMKKIIGVWEKSEEVLTYDKACEEAGYDHRQENSPLKHFFPARPEMDEVINPVVYRTICQLHKVLQAIVKEHGHPAECVIEVARDLAHSHKQRYEIKKGQGHYKKNKDKYVKLFNELIGRDPKGDELTKYRLWKEQHDFCVYSMGEIGMATFKQDINGENSLQIDHIIPYSRCFDNTMNNKVLVRTDENLQKKNQTPYEYLGGATDSERWQKFNTLVNSLNLKQAKKNKLLLTEMDEDGFKNRNLVDTQYIARLATQYLSCFENAEKETIKVICRKGGITADLRHRWGLNKDRSEGDKHHAMDAMVLAVSTDSQMQRITKLHQGLDYDPKYREIRRELKKEQAKEKKAELKAELKEHRENKIYQEKYKKYFEEPWIDFRQDVLAALKNLFVSHRVSRKVTGKAHEETIYAWDKEKKLAKVRTRLANISKDGWKNLLKEQKDLFKPLPKYVCKEVEKRLNEDNFKKYKLNIDNVEEWGKGIKPEKFKKILADIFKEPLTYKNKHGRMEKITAFYAWDKEKKLAKVRTRLANITKKRWKDLLLILPEDVRGKIDTRLKKHNYNLRDLEGLGEDIPDKQLKDIFKEPLTYKNKHGRMEKITAFYAWDKEKKLAKVRTRLANITKKRWKDLLLILPEDVRGKIDTRLKKHNYNLRDLEGLGEDIPDKQLKDIFKEPLTYKNKHGRMEKITAFRVPRPDQKTGLNIHGATPEEKQKTLVANASMVRIDVFKTAKGFIASPLYVSDVVKKILPIYIKDKKTKKWREMEKEEQESLPFCFSLQKNDLIEYVRDKDKEYIYRGYYDGFNIANEQIAAYAPDRRHFLRKEKKFDNANRPWEEKKLDNSKKEKKEGLMESIGILTMPHFKKLHVEVLGRIYQARPEKEKLKPLREGQKVIYHGS